LGRPSGGESVFDADMHPPSRLPGTPISVRAPKNLNLSPLAGGTDDGRMKPSGVDLEGLKATFEGNIVDAGGGKMPYYCYVYYWPDDGSAPGGPNGPDQALHDQLQSKFAASLSSWEDVECETPDGDTKTWKKLRCTGNQEFYYVDASGQEDYQAMDGTMEFYSSGDVFPGHTVIIGWRMPTIIEPNVALAEWGPTVAGSVVVE
jgi:hypothetical protein